MPGVTLGNYANAMRTVYKKMITRTFTANRVLREKMRAKIDKTAQGNKITFPYHVRPSGSVYYTDGVDLPTAQRQRWERGEATYVNLFARVMVEGPAIAASSSSEAAEAEAFDFEMQRIRDDIKYLDHRALWLGSEGKLGTISSVSAAVTIVVTAAHMRYFRIGDWLDICTTASGAEGYGKLGARVADCNYSTNTITLDADTPVSNWSALNTNKANYALYWAGGRLKWPWGVADVVLSGSNPTAGNYCGIDRSGTNSWFNAQVVTQTGTLKLVSIQDVIDQVEMYGSGNIERIGVFCDRTTWNFIASALVTDRRFGGNQKALEGWANALNFNGTPIVKDQHCPANEIYIFDFSFWTHYQSPKTGAGRWIDEDGSLLARVPGKDAYEAAWKMYGNTICRHPAGQGKLTGFTL